MVFLNRLRKRLSLATSGKKTKLLREKKNIYVHCSTWQTLAEGVFWLVWASRSEIPCGNGLLFKVHRDSYPSGDDKPGLKSVFARWGIPEELVSNNIWNPVEVSLVRGIHSKVWIQAYHMKPTSPPGEWCRIKWSANLQADPETRRSIPCAYGVSCNSHPSPHGRPHLSWLLKDILTTLPSITKVLEPKIPCHSAVKKADAETKKGYKESFDRRNDTRELLQLQPGEWVRTKLDNEKLLTTAA